jgi:broad specificity phosphatase PhoE
MPMLEIRRHSKRDGEQAVHLSQAGVELARWAGTLMGPFEVVAASVAPRTRETAIAMGFAVTVEIPTLPNISEFMVESQQAAREPGGPFTKLARLIERPGPSVVIRCRHCAAYSRALAAQWRHLMTTLGPGDAALVIGHGGHLECGLIALFPEEDHESWGPMFDYMEGARIHYDSSAGHFHDVEIVRM